jgi:hypothetical protein
VRELVSKDGRLCLRSRVSIWPGAGGGSRFGCPPIGLMIDTFMAQGAIKSAHPWYRKRCAIKKVAL